MCVCVYASVLTFVEEVTEYEVLFVVSRSTHQTHSLQLHVVLQFNTLWSVPVCETACFKSCDVSGHAAYANICLICFNLHYRAWQAPPMQKYWIHESSLQSQMVPQRVRPWPAGLQGCFPGVFSVSDLSFFTLRCMLRCTKMQHSLLYDQSIHVHTCALHIVQCDF